MEEQGRSVEVVVESLAAGGDGVAHLEDGRVLFLPFAAPGDRLRARVVRERERMAFGRIEALLVPGPGRVEPPCPVHGRCGGCSWQHLDPPTQLAAKREILRDALERLGGLSLPELPRVHASPPYGYRLRARLLCRDGRAGYRERGSHRLCAVEACPVLAPALEAALARPAFAAGAEHEVELLLDREGVARARALPGEAGRAGEGEPAELDTPGGPLRVSPGVFAQANAPLLEPLVRRVVECALVGRPEEAVELFAGAGLFTLALAPHLRRLVAVESHAPAVADLDANLRRQGHAHVQPVRAEAGRWLREPMPPLERAPDLLLLDPPRTGLGRGASGRLAALAPRRIVYVSCDPATLARDLRVLCGRGYRLEGVEGFDCFPQTPHLEALATLRREASPAC